MEMRNFVMKCAPTPKKTITKRARAKMKTTTSTAITLDRTMSVNAVVVPIQVKRLNRSQDTTKTADRKLVVVGSATLLKMT